MTAPKVEQTVRYWRKRVKVAPDGRKHEAAVHLKDAVFAALKAHRDASDKPSDAERTSA